jgi:FlaA1/EpsC-like NDP-sugar epimerase
MGETKRAAELLIKRYARKYPHYRFITVRFGNVLNSSGSVLPIFTRQVQNHLPITITSKEMTRYFMSIPEAVSLVLMANVIGKNGQVLVLDMGEPVKILDLALQLIRMHGLEPYTDIPIVEIGIRPGEKIHEELAYDSNQLIQSTAARIFIAEEL